MFEPVMTVDEVLDHIALHDAAHKAGGKYFMDKIEEVIFSQAFHYYVLTKQIVRDDDHGTDYGTEGI